MAKSSFPTPTFKEGQKVKFNTDPDGHAGTIKEITWSSADGFRYIISSKYFDSEQNDMVEGVKICQESELLDMEDKE